MTGRQLAGVWAAAFALVLTIVIALLPLDENDHAHPHQAIRKVLEATPAWDTIVIGSSLTRAAFPPVTGPASLPDRTAVRISRSGLKQNELLLIAEYALAAGADEIFIEAERGARTRRDPHLDWWAGTAGEAKFEGYPQRRIPRHLENRRRVPLPRRKNPASGLGI